MDRFGCSSFSTNFCKYPTSLCMLIKAKQGGMKHLLKHCEKNKHGGTLHYMITFLEKLK